MTAKLLAPSAGLGLSAALLFTSVGGCSAPYLIHLAAGQSRIILESRPIEEALRDPSTTAETKEKLELVLAVKRFGEEAVGLKASTSFTSYVPAGKGTSVWVLTAAPKLELEAVRWSFPLAGSFPYKGYFDRSMAEAEVERLKRKGLDTHLRLATAYSTLGWFTDPVFEPMLGLNDITIANVILHEKTHATVFVKGDLAFNEGLASFVGAQGTVEFFSASDGPGSPRALEAVGRMEDERRFGRFVKGVLEELKELYSSGLPDGDKLKLRQEAFEASKDKLRGQAAGYNYPDMVEFYTTSEVNNAFLLSLELYTVDIDTYMEAFERLGRDLPETVAFFKSVGKRSADPVAYLRQWLKSVPPEAASRPGATL